MGLEYSSKNMVTHPLHKFKFSSLSNHSHVSYDIYLEGLNRVWYNVHFWPLYQALFLLNEEITGSLEIV